MRVSFALLALAGGASAQYKPTYYDGCGDLVGCAKWTRVFGLVVCFSAPAKAACATDSAKCDHIVNVYYQMLDNDGDGVVDDTTVYDEMKKVRARRTPRTRADGPGDGAARRSAGVPAVGASDGG